jgi:hypothetical protein
MMTEGNYTLYFVGSQSQTPIAISLNVQGFHPWVTLNNYAPSPHTRIGFVGQDFVPGEQILVYLNQPGSENLRPDTHGPGKLVARVQADTNGGFAAPAAWEVSAPGGQYTLVFVGQQSGIVINTPFTVMH